MKKVSAKIDSNGYVECGYCGCSTVEYDENGKIIDEEDISRVYKRCISAMTRNETNYIEVGYTRKDGSKGSLCIKIFRRDYEKNYS